MMTRRARQRQGLRWVCGGSAVGLRWVSGAARGGPDLPTPPNPGTDGSTPAWLPPEPAEGWVTDLLGPGFQARTLVLETLRTFM